MAEVSCQAQLPEDSSAGLTVGQRFVLRCEGAWPTMDSATLELRLDEADKYKLKLLGYNPVAADQSELLVVSYVVGPHELKAAQLTDSANSVVLNGLKFEVKSVQNPEQPVQEPFPPMGPMAFFPWFFVGFLAVLLGTVLLGVFFGYARRRQRANLMKEIFEKVYQYPPLPEFYRELRSLQRQYLFLTDPKASAEGADLSLILRGLDQQFRILLARVYQLPAHRWPSHKTLKELNETLGKDSVILPGLRQLLRELDRAAENTQKLQGADLEQISRLMRQWVDQSAAALNDTTKSKKGKDA